MFHNVVGSVLAMANLTISDTHSHEGTPKLAEIELHSTGKWEPGRTLNVPGQVWAQVQCTGCIVGDYTIASCPIQMLVINQFSPAPPVLYSIISDLPVIVGYVLGTSVYSFVISHNSLFCFILVGLAQTFSSNGDYRSG